MNHWFPARGCGLVPNDESLAAQQGRILVVDDDPRMVASLETLLAMHGHEIDSADGGAAALVKLRGGDYDVLLLDLQMPGVDGFQVMMELHNSGSPVVTIVVSGSRAFAEIGRALELGAYDYIKKPYVPEELLVTVRNSLRKRHLERNRQAMLQALEQTNLLNRFIVEHSPDLIFVIDEEGRFRFVNARFNHLLGYVPEELLGTSFHRIASASDVSNLDRFFQEILGDLYQCRSLEVALSPAGSGTERRYFEIQAFSFINGGGQGENKQVYGTAREITERKATEEALWFHSLHDALTSLPSRTLFQDRVNTVMTQKQRDNGRFSIMFIDLDHFKLINDSLGHYAGDQLLKLLSQRLLDCVRKSDTLARLGGDEFALLLPGSQTLDAAIRVAKKILKAVERPFSLSRHDVVVGLSIGIAIYPDHGNSYEDLLRNADAAMYQIKNSGKNGFSLFSHDLGSDAMRCLQLEQDLRTALKNSEFDVHYQPQIDAVTKKMFGLEALVRWQHPQDGLLYPDRFISLAEETGIIIDLDLQTLQKACGQMRQLTRHGIKNLRLSVNVSPLLLASRNFADKVLQILQATSFPPELLALEITESLLLNGREDVLAGLHRLSQAGIHIAIDDFGTGYSSLSYLHKLPVDHIKIDRSFVGQIGVLGENTAIVDAILSMAKRLKLKVVAEGVENRRQLQYLVQLECDYVQGFLFSEPMPFKQLVGMLKCMAQKD
jgi:diguanylate cyclase (GGDEF)-like protein/PAS domain S-box-containing protein